MAQASDDPQITEAHIRSFRRRADFHSIYSYIVSFLVLVLFVFAVTIFFLAGRINGNQGSVQRYATIVAALDGKDDLLSARQSEVKGITGEQTVGLRTTQDVASAIHNLYSLQGEIALLKTKRDLSEHQGYPASVDESQSKEEFSALLNVARAELQDLQAFKLDTDRRFAAGEVTRTDVLTAEAYVGDAVSRIKVLEAEVKAAPAAAEVKARSADIDMAQMINANVIRFGGAITTIFLIGLLIPVYRYNVRLANFYKARADALVLCRDLQTPRFLELSEALTPKFTFDTEPKSPIDSVASLISAAAGAKK